MKERDKRVLVGMSGGIDLSLIHIYIAKAKEIIATVSAEKAAHLPEQMIQNIAKGRLGKFLKEVCLLNQEDIMDAKKTVREVLAAADPELKVLDFKRFTLKAE